MEKALLILNIIYLLLSGAFFINLICNIGTSKKRFPGGILPILNAIIKASIVVLTVLLKDYIIVDLTRDIIMIIIWFFIAYIIYLYNEGIIKNRHHIKNKKKKDNDIDKVNEFEDNI